MAVDAKLVKQLRDRTNLGMNDCKKALEESNGDMEAAIDLLKKWGELKGAEKASRVATEGRIGLFSNNSATSVSMIEVNCQTDFVANSSEFRSLLMSSSLASGKLFAEDEFEQKRKELVAKTGENIVLRRQVLYNRNPNSHITWYLHPGDKLGVILEVCCSKITDDVLSFADDCAMQVAAMSPVFVKKDEIDANTLVRQRRIFEAQLREEKKPEAAWQKIIEGKFGKWRKDIVLLEQESIKDPKKSVDDLRQELVKKLGVELSITRFVRYALGEGLEKKQDDLAEEVSKLIK